MEFKNWSVKFLYLDVGPHRRKNPASVYSLVAEQNKSITPHWSYREGGTDKFPMNKRWLIEINCAVPMVAIFKDLWNVVASLFSMLSSFYFIECSSRRLLNSPAWSSPIPRNITFKEKTLNYSWFHFQSVEFPLSSTSTFCANFFFHTHFTHFTWSFAAVSVIPGAGLWGFYFARMSLALAL